MDSRSMSRLSNSSSPRTQTSNLTSALQEAGAAGNQMQFLDNEQHPGHHNYADIRGPDLARNDSLTNIFGSSYLGAGARPITMNQRTRRESNTGSFMGGMSWGNNSINASDWVRDDVMMAGTSPSAFPQPSSFQSSSYLPKLEANYFRDYFCCGTVFPSLHDLMQHNEENHGHQSIDILNRPSVSNQSGITFAKQPMPPTPQQSRAAPQTAQAGPAQVTRGFQTPSIQARSVLATIQDDPLDTMEMDTNMGGQMPPSSMSNTAFNSPAATQPVTTQPFNFMATNPTVSSVNTPQFGQSTADLQQAMINIDGSADLFGGVPLMPGDINNYDFSNLGMSQDLAGMTINDPANQLISRNGVGALQMQQFMNMANPDGSSYIMGSDLATVAWPNATNNASQQQVQPEGEKKYRCPVIGCEKAYKNQNGLKYHKTHGHTTQKLKLNENGTFSIVDPVTSIPYPGTMGMEKEKPYKCDACGKRYKNLNGLKYHRAHSPRCNPPGTDGTQSPTAGASGSSTAVQSPNLMSMGQLQQLQQMQQLMSPNGTGVNPNSMQGGPVDAGNMDPNSVAVNLGGLDITNFSQPINR